MTPMTYLAPLALQAQRSGLSWLPWALCLLVVSAPALAEIYRYRAPDGTVVFSDRPRPGSTRIEVGPNLTVPATPVEQEPSKPPAPPTATYESLEIVSPVNDETIRDNAGNVTVGIESRPILQSKQGHRLVVLMDGSPIGPPTTAMQIPLENIDRGSHTLQAIIVDANGQPLIRSGVLTFHLRRHSSLFNRSG